MPNVTVYLALDEEQNIVLGKQDAICLDINNLDIFRQQLREEHRSEVFLIFTDNPKGWVE